MNVFADSERWFSAAPAALGGKHDSRTNGSLHGHMPFRKHTFATGGDAPSCRGRRDHRRRTAGGSGSSAGLHPLAGPHLGHLCVLHEPSGALPLGDHVLAHVTPAVGIGGPNETNPLVDYLTSLRRVRRYDVHGSCPATATRSTGLRIGRTRSPTGTCTEPTRWPRCSPSASARRCGRWYRQMSVLMDFVQCHGSAAGRPAFASRRRTPIRNARHGLHRGGV